MRRFCRFSSTLRCHSCQRVCSVREHARVVDRIINLSAFARACVCVCVLTPILVWHLYFYGGQQPLSMLPVPAAYDCGPYRAARCDRPHGPGSYYIYIYIDLLLRRLIIPCLRGSDKKWSRQQSGFEHS